MLLLLTNSSIAVAKKRRRRRRRRVVLVWRGSIGYGFAAVAGSIGGVLLCQATATAEDAARVRLKGIATAGFFELNRSW